MRHLIMMCLAISLMTGLSGSDARATETVNSADAMIENYVKRLYNDIDFDKGNKLSYEIFSKAYKGYLNLREAGKLNNDKDILTVCDFTQSSNNNRMWIIDLKERKLLYNTYVAHGAGTGEEFATHFSNNFESHQSSIGFYVTGGTYMGEHGNSLYLHGMDQGYNNNAYDRSIVLHGAPYVCKQFIKGNERLGRSWGCPAVSDKLAQPIIKTIQDGTCLFIYYPEKSYLKTAYWMNKPLADVPQFISEEMNTMLVTTKTGKKKRGPVKVVYADNVLPKNFHMRLPL